MLVDPRELVIDVYFIITGQDFSKERDYRPGGDKYNQCIRALNNSIEIIETFNNRNWNFLRNRILLKEHAHTDHPAYKLPYRNLEMALPDKVLKVSTSGSDGLKFYNYAGLVKVAPFHSPTESERLANRYTQYHNLHYIGNEELWATLYGNVVAINRPLTKAEDACDVYVDVIDRIDRIHKKKMWNCPIPQLLFAVKYQAANDLVANDYVNQYKQKDIQMQYLEALRNLESLDMSYVMPDIIEQGTGYDMLTQHTFYPYDNMGYFNA